MGKLRRLVVSDLLGGELLNFNYKSFTKGDEQCLQKNWN